MTTSAELLPQRDEGVRQQGRDPKRPVPKAKGVRQRRAPKPRGTASGELFPLEDKVVQRRQRRDPKPHFKQPRSGQLDVLLGSLEEQLPAVHLAREVAGIVAQFDTASLEATYSSLGRHGHHPKTLLRVWVYGSLMGFHHATKLARAQATDIALRWLSDGHGVSGRSLCRFRGANGELFQRAIDTTLEMALLNKLIEPDELAVDSMRLRAHAATREVRTVVRSEKRLDQLAKADVTAMAPDVRAAHDAKVTKHREALELCAKRDRASVVLTNEMAALMKFPNGAAMPGHRITVTATGVKTRLIVSVLVDDATNDFGKLGGAVVDARAALQRAGLPVDKRLGVVADAGYAAEQDYLFAKQAEAWADVLIASNSSTTDHAGEGAGVGRKQKYFGRERFTLRVDDSVLCPADRVMRGPFDDHSGRTKWLGDGCPQCALRPQCTKGEARAFTASLERERIRAAMQDRLATPEGKARYGRRMAIVEPVFADIEDVMGFRRASSRQRAAVIAEVLLKVLAHNLSRILQAARLTAIPCLLTVDGALVPLRKPAQ